MGVPYTGVGWLAMIFICGLERFGNQVSCDGVTLVDFSWPSDNKFMATWLKQIWPENHIIEIINLHQK